MAVTLANQGLENLKTEINVQDDLIDEILDLLNNNKVSPVNVEPLTVVEDGVYTAPEGKAYNPVIVSVEGRVTGTVIVTAPTGSTVTATKGTDERTATEEGGTWTFSGLEFGSWVITATKGTQAASKTVTVDSITAQSIEIVYQVKNTTYLYYLGDECEDITGGWSADGYGNSNVTIISGVKNTNNIYLKSQGDTTWSALGTIDSVDLSNYKTIVSCANVLQMSRSDRSLTMANLVKNPMYSGSNYTNVISYGETGLKIRTGDVSNKSDRRFIIMNGDGGYSGTSEIYYYGLALAKADNITGLSEYGSTIDAILANSDTLLANESAVDYMLSTCTGDFMWSAVSNQSFKIALYGTEFRDKIFDNEEWAKALRLVGYVKEQKLPVGYVELDSIESTGTQIINSGVVGSSNVTKMLFKYNEVATNTVLWSFGTDGQTGYSYGGYKSSRGMNFYWNKTSVYHENFVEPTNGEYELTVINDTNVSQTLNGNTISVSKSTFASGTNLFILSTANGLYKKSCKLKFATVDVDYITVRHLHPCIRLSDGEIGMYDLCESASPYDGTPFYGNSGTGSFRIGAIKDKWFTDEYQQVEYLEFTGTQILDTGVTLSNPTIGMEALYNTFNGNDFITGVRDSWYSGGCEFNITLNHAIDYGYGSSALSTVKSDPTTNHWYTFVIDKGKFYADDILLSTKTGTPSSTVTVLIGSVHVGGAGFFEANFCGRLKKFYIKNNGINNYFSVPAVRISDSEKGMLDLVSREMTTSIGTGEFNVGADVDPS